MKRLTFAASFIILLCILVIAHNRTWDLRASRSQTLEIGHVPPAPFLRLVSFGFDGILSDQLFLKLITSFGEHILNGVPLAEEDWSKFHQSLDVVTELDPYFLDPYFLTEGFLAWEAKKVEEANTILIQGAEHLTWDWRLPYFVGFNYFYFLNDYKKGADWLMKASEISGSPSFLPTLASRLSYYGGEASTGVAFLKEFKTQVTEPAILKAIDKRIEALEMAALLESAVFAFQKEYGRPPKSKEIIEKGFIKEMPQDPYGGKWIILENGRVFSTSKFVSEKKRTIPKEQD